MMRKEFDIKIMKKILITILILSVAVVMTSCQGYGSQIIVKPTITFKSTNIPTLSTTPKKTSLPSATSPIAMTKTPILTSTPSPVFFQNISSNAPLPEPGFSYELQIPDPDLLITLLTKNREAGWESLLDLSGHGNSQAKEWEYHMLNDLIAFDLEHYYPNGVPNASRYVQRVISEWEGQYYITSKTIIHILVTGLLQSINEEQVNFSDQRTLQFQIFTVTPYSVDLDGDKQTEWFVEVDSPAYEFRTWLALESSMNGGYEVIPNDFPVLFITSSNDQITQLSVDHDFTGDGVKDIVLGSLSYLAGSMSGSATLFAWNGEGIYPVNSVSLPGVTPRYSEANQSGYEIVDIDNNGISELQVIVPNFLWFDCTWDTVYIYSWDGKQQAVVVKDKEIPLKPSCYIANSLLSKSPSEQAQLYEAALLELAPDISPDLEAWLQLQLIVAYSGQGRDLTSIKLLESLLASKNDGRFLKIIQDEVSVVGKDPVLLCQSLYENAKSKRDSGSRLGTEIDDDLTYLGGYPVTFEIDPAMVCPYWDLLMNRVSVIQISNTVIPAESLESLSYSLLLPTTINLDNDSQYEWIGIIDLERPLVVMLDDKNSRWNIHPIEYIDRSPTKLDVGVYYSGSDNLLETLIMLTMSNHEYSTCELGTQTYHLILSTRRQNGDRLTKWRTFSCKYNPPVNLYTEKGKIQFIDYVNACPRCDLMNDFDTTEGVDYPAWVKMEGFVDQQESVEIFEYIEDKVQSVLTTTDVEDAQKNIENLMAYLPKNDDSTEIILNQLKYVLGLSYELSNSSEEAVQHYLSLISESPDSLWSWLAWARLSPNPISDRGQ